MDVIDFLQVTRNKKVIKRFPQAGGVGVSRILGEEKEKMGRGRGIRIERVGDWTVVIMASHLRLLSLCAWGGKLSAKQGSMVSDQGSVEACGRFRAVRAVRRARFVHGVGGLAGPQTRGL